jgi:hypothetical protein
VVPENCPKIKVDFLSEIRYNSHMNNRNGEVEMNENLSSDVLDVLDELHAIYSKLFDLGYKDAAQQVLNAEETLEFQLGINE